MYPNLNAEMARKGLSVKDLQTIIRKTDRTTRDKVNGSAAWTLREASDIRDAYFPGLSLDYLFERSPREGKAG